MLPTRFVPHFLLLPLLTVGAAAAQAPASHSALGTATVSSAVGTADVNGRLNAFRALGGFEINWDGVKLDGTDFNGNTEVVIPGKTVGIPLNRFQSRGVFFEEIYAVSGDDFVSANPGVAGQLPDFSPANTFAMFNENTIDMSFVLASDPATTPVPAAVRSFGVVFEDVEKPNTTSIECFYGDVSLGKFYVPAGPSQSFEFLGITFANPVITRVTITVGDGVLFHFHNDQVTAGDADLSLGGTKDLASTDNFVYTAPTAAYVPPPPARAALTTAEIAGFEFWANILNGSSVLAAAQVFDCTQDTLCASGPVAGRAELLTRVLGPKPNGKLWPFVVRFSTSQVELWIRQKSTGKVNYYLLPGATQDSNQLGGFFDRQGFLP